MISYTSAIRVAANDTISMPDPLREPGKFIVWAEDICILLSNIYGIAYDQVCEDLQEALGLLEDNE